MKHSNEGKSITVAFRNQYGTDTIVPACETSRIFASIAGTRTLTKPAIDAIKALGYVVNVKQTIRSI